MRQRLFGQSGLGAWVALLASVATTVILAKVLPYRFAAASSVLSGFSVFYFLSGYLNLWLPDKGRIAFYTIAFQMAVLAVTAPWIGWETEAIRSWFGRFVFVYCFVAPLIVFMGQWWATRASSSRADVIAPTPGLSKAEDVNEETPHT